MSSQIWGHADNEDITRASQLILSGCNNLTELKIASQNHEAPDSGAMGFEQRIFATLRDNKINASLEQQMQLKHLTLSGLNLAIFGAGHHRTTIDFSSLETLHILSCKKVHIFLDAVCRSKDPPRRLKKLTWHMTDLDEWRLRLNATMTRFEYLLRRQRELSDLAVIVNDRTRFPSVRDIVSRAKTLRVLSMMSTAHEATRVRFWMPRAVKEICDRCKGLVQLGLELHVEGLGRPWRSCVQSIVFRRALDSILQLEHLKALDLGNFWAVRYEQNARIGYTPEYDFFCFKRELREIAEVLFNARHLEKPEKRFNLEVVGASYYTDAERTLDGQPEAEPDEFIPPRILLTRVETGVAGKECRRAVPVNRCWTKKNLKDCDIFSSDDLYWSHAPTNGFPQ
ncbi:uncharacterized protein KY384_005077 [Bacidia gigantensis]|uniref:uncharacterized protein n=1 Tax=Bacidia gigantensis TaxID=2732470 RepID=UPI001D04FE8B|nr:uncharacterized protein KY384_005077 [Bacidia gigantensis]KAG8530574.1 hypothetical protein KY384_005077 [Bacidia gigantensis]